MSAVCKIRYFFALLCTVAMFAQDGIFFSSAISDNLFAELDEIIISKVNPKILLCLTTYIYHWYWGLNGRRSILNYRIAKFACTGLVWLGTSAAAGYHPTDNDTLSTSSECYVLSN